MRFDSNLFFLLISPPSEIKEYVTYLKKRVREILGHHFDGFNSIAHLTLLQYEDLHNEDELYRIEERASKIREFNIFIKNFSVFKNNHTTFLDIVNKAHVMDLRENALRRGDSFFPHITIAKNLQDREFDRVKDFLHKESCSLQFRCDRITVLKSNGHYWKSHMDLQLKS